MARPKKGFNGKSKKSDKSKKKKKGLGMGGALAIVAGGGALVGGALFGIKYMDEQDRKKEAARQKAIKDAQNRLKKTERKDIDFGFGKKPR